MNYLTSNIEEVDYISTKRNNNNFQYFENYVNQENNTESLHFDRTDNLTFWDDSYLINLPGNINIFSEAKLNSSPNNNNAKYAVLKFISTFQRILINNKHTISQSLNLPPLKFVWLEDESVLIEWIFKDFRIGFSIEPKLDESSWYLVTNQKYDEYSESGIINFNELELLLLKLLNFTIVNS